VYPEDPVLVAVINRRRDLKAAMDEHWYRVPVKHMPRGIDARYVGFFLSRSFGPSNGGVRYFAPVCGIELVYRRWLLPDEPDHPRSDELYYRLALGALIPKSPPILNPAHRIITFVHTSWEQFTTARVIDELYLRLRGASHM
jgi:hypothetical protein